MKKNSEKEKQPKLKIKKGDMVVVIAGKDRSVGPKRTPEPRRVLSVYPEKMQVLVEGVNIRVRHVRPNAQFPEGTRLEREQPIHYSNVMLADGNNKPTRAGIRVKEDGSKERIAKTTGSVIS